MKKLSNTEVDLKKAACDNMCSCLDCCVSFAYIELRYRRIRSNIHVCAKNGQKNFFNKDR